MIARTGFAGAKVNLYLHVGPPGPQGFHPIDSLMVFADVGDSVTLDAAPDWRFEADGPFSAAAPMNEDNLVARAARAVIAAAGSEARFRLHLHKRLPVAAGLGGGSADAGAAMRLVNATLYRPLRPHVLQATAARLGSDVPACLAGQPVIARGRGEQLFPAPALPPLHAVLVNPGVPTPTGPVFAAYDRAGPHDGDLDPAPPAAFDSAESLAAWLRAQTRNDLEAPARGLVAEAGAAVDRLAASPLALLARMSGSGATAFALCAGEGEAQRLAEEIGLSHPAWWVKACQLGANPD